MTKCGKRATVPYTLYESNKQYITTTPWARPFLRIGSDWIGSDRTGLAWTSLNFGGGVSLVFSLFVMM